MTSVTTNPILVVDDEQTIRLGFSVALRAVGFEVIVAADGPEALARAAEITPDCVLLDLRMPGMDGLETARRLRDTGYDRPIVMASAFADHRTAVTAIGEGITDFLTKPIKPTQLRYAINHALSRYARFAHADYADAAHVPTGLLRAYAKHCLCQRRIPEARLALTRLIADSSDLQSLLLLGAICELEGRPEPAAEFFVRAAEVHANRICIASSNELFKVFSHSDQPTSD